MGRYPEADLTKVKRHSIAKRKSRVGRDNLASIPDPGKPLEDFINGLPDILKARDLREVAAAVIGARRKKRPVILMMGAHPIKCGLNPVIIDLMKMGFITGLATNGAGAIHDFEMACWGRTSEDVSAGLEDGSFGMARETADLINGAVIQGDAQELGFGESLGLMLNEEKFPYINHSLLAECYRLKIPFTVHVAVGTDIIHQHPSADGASIGSASHRDFRILAAETARLSGGVVINLGSSVILPEVFLKALTVARNLGHPVKNFTTANFDMIQHYRPNLNVVRRPISCGGKGYSITGHHEIMLPLLAAMIKSKHISRKGK
ncbi:MAG: hypothetical protein KJ620_10520 [Candidatus Edwardsbacteria bacterium]|nr:hypothetical protein [Candidatus Edwardsbacteria bacterium]MBU1576559.1 hypothetical protein [Candidatus Edwardsbacteria bacterium]MBU2462759.1 hypothetical protein [Candidatus Edwardsbacteria bacterium]MBU2594766.1 hypothetical protein [Candidatus Edwardsbacteria bacterium]